jgi:5-methyltetrahydrofolate--homocysteine methyltransferase
VDRRVTRPRADQVPFPRQHPEPFLCIADFFRPIDSRRGRLRGLPDRHHGRAGVASAPPQLFDADQYQDYLLLHGIGVEMAEALAEYWHHRIRQEWGFADEDGPNLAGPVPPAVPRRALLVGLPGVPRPRGQREGGQLLEAHRIGEVEASSEEHRLCHHPKASTSPGCRPERAGDEP